MGYLGRTPTPSPVTIDDIPANSIDASKIVDGSIEVSDIKDNSITDAKLNSTKLDGIADSANNYTHPAAHTVSEVTGLQGLLDGKVDDSQVLTNVPSGALFTDTNTIYTHPAAHTVSEVTGLQGLLDGKTTETYVNTKVAALVASSPATLDTLNELAAALGNDPNFATTVTNSIGTKLPLAGGTMTGTIAGFTSTGIDDNAAGNRLIITDTGLGINTTPSVMLDIGASGKPGEIRVTNDVYDSWILQKRRSDNTQICGIKESGSGGLSFLVNGAAEKVRITSAGKVGIGTSSVSQKLVVYSDITADGILVDVLSQPRIVLRDRGNSDTVIGTGKYGLDDLYIDTYSGNALAINGATRNVGIGTPNPVVGLEVASSVIKSNGKRTYSFGGYMLDAATYNYDITVRNESGTGNTFFVTAGYAHTASPSYSCALVASYATRATAVASIGTLTNQSSINAGSWSVTKPNVTTLRVTKNAGTYAGSGYGHVTVVFES